MEDILNIIYSEVKSATSGEPRSTDVLAYLVSDPSNPGSEFLVSKSAVIKSGLILNKVVSLSAWTVDAGGKVEIVSSNMFHLTGLHYAGPGTLQP